MNFRCIAKVCSCYMIWNQDCQSDKKFHGRVRCVVLLSVRPEMKDEKYNMTSTRNGFLQISPTRHGPWTTVRLNYAARAACWRLGNDVVASEVTVKDGNRYVGIRSLVSVTNKTDFDIDLRLKSKSSSGNLKLDDTTDDEDKGLDENRSYTEEFFEIETYTPSVGWVSSSSVTPLSSCNRPENNYQVNGCIELLLVISDSIYAFYLRVILC